MANNGTPIGFVFGRLIACYSGGTGLWFNTDGRLVFEQGSSEFSSGNSGFKTVFPHGITKAQLQLKSKEISTQMLTRNVGLTFAAGSYQTIQEEPTVTAATVTIAHAVYNDLINVYSMNDYDWTRYIDVSPAAPQQGEYSISGTTLTFNALDEGQVLTVQYAWNSTATGTRGLMPFDFVPSPITGTFRQLMGERRGDGKNKYIDWYFKDLQPASDRIDIGSAVDNFNDDYTETYNVAPSSLLYCSMWTEP